MFYFKLGGISLEPGETECLGFIRRRVYSDRQEPLYETRILTVVIDQTLTGVKANSDRWKALDNVKSPLSVGFYDTVDGQTPIWLSTDQSLSGIRMTTPLSWTPRSQVEFATHLTMYMSFEADYPLDGASEIMEYEETVTFEDAGPVKIQSLEMDTGPPEIFVTSQQPHRYVIQSGSFVTRSTYGLANPPMFSNFPIIERQLPKGSPRKLGSSWIGYRVAWRYVFLVQDAGNWFPRLR